ncbi:molecular chaperone Tir [Haloferula helveola]|uniref:Molecular chaperone Tir n=2 Tax=Haloferula helveola TaxID=490095 RepID=A0ABM7RBM7_9BACT|nr:molecular chaperone Tir [Haloferula helveola]
MAISYGGGERSFMREVDRALLDYFAPDEVFYDERNTALFGRPDAGKWLAGVYRDASLAVIFYSDSHAGSPWCQRELNAARDRDVSGGEPVQLFHFGDAANDSILGFGMEYWLSIDRKYQSDPDKVAAAVAEFYNKEVRERGEPQVTKRRRPTKARLAAELIVLLAIVGGLSAWTSFGGAEEYDSVLGVASLGAFFVAVFFLMLRVYLYLGRLDKPVTYDPLPEEANPDGSLVESTEDRLRREREEWRDYSHQLEVYHQSKMSVVGETMRSLRGSRIVVRSGLLMGMALATYHLVLELVVRNHAADEKTMTAPPVDMNGGGTAEPQASPFLDSMGDSKNWDLLKAYTEHHAHICLAGGAVCLAFLLSLWFAGGDARNRAVSFAVGISAPLLVGCAYVAFMVGSRYDDLFPEGSQPFTGELGNFLVVERLLLIPAICYIAAWLGCLLRKHFQKVPA